LLLVIELERCVEDGGSMVWCIVCGFVPDSCIPFVRIVPVRASA